MALVAACLALCGFNRPGTSGLLVLLALTGVGMGLFTSPNNAAIMGSVPGSEAGMASGLLNMTRGLGTALGLALTGLVFTVASRGDIAPHLRADHAFTVTALVLAGIAAGAGVVAALRTSGELGDTTMVAVD
jgi:MFS family permease